MEGIREFSVGSTAYIPAALGSLVLVHVKAVEENYAEVMLMETQERIDNLNEKFLIQNKGFCRVPMQLLIHCANLRTALKNR